MSVTRLAPLTKAARQARVGELISGPGVRSQGELAGMLAGEGVNVTQATLSRDLEELGAIKRRGRYALPGETTGAGPRDARSRLARLAEELLVSAEAAANLLVLRTPPGAANLLASALDGAGLAGLLGTVAGDDTLLLVCRDQAIADELAHLLLKLAEAGT